MDEQTVAGPAFERLLNDALWQAYRHLRDAESCLAQTGYFARLLADEDKWRHEPDERQFNRPYEDYTDHIHLQVLPRLRKVIGKGTDSADSYTVMGLING